MDYPSNFNKNPDLARFSYSPNMPGISTGQPTIDMLISLLLSGMNLPAIPGRGQSVYDAMQQRDRSKDYLKLMQQAFGSQLVMQKLGGFDTNTSMGKIASMMMGRPDGIMDSSIMQAFNGGNPIKAMMGLNADMTGQTMAMGFGTHANASTQEVAATFDAMQKQFYRQHTLDSTDLNKAGSQHSKELFDTFGKDKKLGEFFKEFEKKDTDGKDSFDFEGFKAKAKEYAEKATKTADKAVIDAYTQVLQRADSMAELKNKLGTEISTSVDGKATRGFALQGITKSYTKAMDLGLSYDADTRFNEQTGHSPEIARKAAGQFGNAIKVLAAVRDITGSDEADKAMDELNQLLQNSAVNLNDADQSTQIANLLRRYNAAAKTLGISIEAMQGMLSTNRAIMSQSEALKYAGGTLSLEMTQKAAFNASAFTSAMGNDYVRRNGGSAQIQQEIQARYAQNLGSAPVTHLAAMAAQIKASNLSDEKKEELYNKLTAAALDPKSSQPMQANQLIDTVANAIGKTRNQLIQSNSSLAAQQAGMNFVAERQRRGKDLHLDEAAISADTNNFIAMATAALDGKMVDGKRMSSNDAAAQVQKFMEGLGRGEDSNDLALKYHLSESIAVDREMHSDRFQNVRMHAARTNPNFRREKDFLEETTKARAVEEERMAEKFHTLQTPLFQSVAQEFLSGNIGKGVEGLAGLFVTDASRERSGALMGAAKDLRMDDSDANFEAAFYQLHGGAKDISSSQLDKNLAAAYITDKDDVARVKRQREAFSSDGLANLTKVSKTLTMNQIMAAAKDWNKSQAKQLGANKDDVLAAGKYLKDTNFASEENMKMYGDHKFNDVRREMLTGTAIGESGRIAQADIINDIEKRSGEDFTKHMEHLKANVPGESEDAAKARADQYAKYREAMDTIGAIKRTKVDGWFGTSFMARDEESYDATKAIEALNADPSKEKDEKKKKALETLRGVKELVNSADSVKEATKNAEEGREAAKSTYGQNAMTSLTSTLGNSSQNITTAITNLTNMLRSFNGTGA